MKINPAHYIILFILIAYTHCQIRKPYMRPQVEITAEYRIDNRITLDDTTNKDTVLWQEIFKDTLLVNLINDALDRNTDLQNALINIQIAEKYVLQSRLLNRPEVGADLLSFTQMYRSENYRSAPNRKWYAEKGKEQPRYMYLQVDEV